MDSLLAKGERAVLGTVERERRRALRGRDEKNLTIKIFGHTRARETVVQERALEDAE